MAVCSAPTVGAQAGCQGFSHSCNSRRLSAPEIVDQVSNSDAEHPPAVWSPCGSDSGGLVPPLEPQGRLHGWLDCKYEDDGVRVRVTKPTTFPSTSRLGVKIEGDSASNDEEFISQQPQASPTLIGYHAHWLPVLSLFDPYPVPFPVSTPNPCPLVCVFVLC